jgi:hypothetical protein
VFEQPRFSKWAAFNLGAGVVWVSQATLLGLVSGLPLWVVASAFLGSGLSQLLWPGDARATQMGALAGGVGVVLSIPYGFALGLGSFFLLAVSAIAAAWGAGRMALQLEPHVDDVPVPRPSAELAAKLVFDEMILGMEQIGSTGFALDGTLERVIDEVERTHAIFEREGYLEKPERYHAVPPELRDPSIRTREMAGLDVEMLRFESGYAPPEGEPGRERWLGYEPCQTAHAYVLRHADESRGPRPWLICTNGYRMGHAAIDVRVFERFHRHQGLNVLIPVQPLHGPRRIGFQSGTGFLGMDVLDTLHAVAQSMWDMRRLLSWIRAQDAPAVGALGFSLGGYATAVFASLVEDLRCAVLGIPLADIPRAVARHAATHQLLYAESQGFDLARVREVLRVVSPLALEPKVPLEGRFFFAATADRLVTPDHVRDLWRHWGEPEIVWYDGGHVTFRTERKVWDGVDRTLRENGLQAP